MNWPFFAFIAIVVGGAALLFFGLRGRRINEHPVCRRCRFDLHGVYPGSVTCPECGAGLKGARAIRTGVRVRRRLPVALGGAMLGVAALAVAAVVWLMAAGPSMNKHKPVVILALEGRYAGSKASREAAREFIRRLKANPSRLREWEVEWGVSTALANQANLTRPWVDDWGEFVEDAQAQGSVDDETFLKYLRQGVVLDCQVRPGVNLGDRVPLVVGVAEWRRSKTPTPDLGVWADGIRVDGKQIEWIHHGERRLAVPNSESPIRIATTSKASWGPPKKPVGADTLGIEIVLPRDLVAGEHAVELDVRVSGEAGATAEALRGKNALSTTLRRTIRISEGVIPFQETSGVAQLKGFLSGAKVEVSVATWGGENNQPACRALVTVPRSGAPSAFAFDVSVRVNGKEYNAGWVLTGRLPRRGRLGLGPNGGLSDPEAEVLLVADIPSDEIPDEALRSCELVFQPRTDLVPLTLDMTGCFGSELVVEGVGMTRLAETAHK